MRRFRNTDYIPRTYNYKLETGTVGTDDDEIANILYNINQLEAKASYISPDAQKSGKKLGEVYFMVSEISEHLDRYADSNEINDDNAALGLIRSAIQNAMGVMEDAVDNKTDTTKAA